MKNILGRCISPFLDITIFLFFVYVSNDQYNIYLYIYLYIDRQIDRQIDRYIERQIYRYIYNIYIYRQINRQIDRQIERQTDRKTSLISLERAVGNPLLRFMSQLCLHEKKVLKSVYIIIFYYIMLFTFGYRTADLSLRYKSFERAQKQIRCSVPIVNGIVCRIYLQLLC